METVRQVDLGGTFNSNMRHRRAHPANEDSSSILLLLYLIDDTAHGDDRTGCAEERGAPILAVADGTSVWKAQLWSNAITAAAAVDKSFIW